jgi:hypothetical protein
MKASWKKDSTTCGGLPYISCMLQNTNVGPKNISITVGGQTSSWNETYGLLHTKCVQGSYGIEGEVCLNCEETFPNSKTICSDPSNDQWGGDPVANTGHWVSYLTEGIMQLLKS